MTNNIRLRILVQQITQFLHVTKVTLWTIIAVTRMAQGFMEGANKQVISSQADSLIKISRIWADFFPANTSNQP
ncbi:hypothetical protein LVT77_21035, partial [Klebsiella pneumoniae]|nr:hypothetical protein [Klebsiella pneumoniae]